MQGCERKERGCGSGRERENSDVKGKWGKRMWVLRLWILHPAIKMEECLPARLAAALLHPSPHLSLTVVCWGTAHGAASAAASPSPAKASRSSTNAARRLPDGISDSFLTGVKWCVGAEGWGGGNVARVRLSCANACKSTSDTCVQCHSAVMSAQRYMGCVSTLSGVSAPRGC